jgi:hypothetical protein
MAELSDHYIKIYLKMKNYGKRDASNILRSYLGNSSHLKYTQTGIGYEIDSHYQSGINRGDKYPGISLVVGTINYLLDELIIWHRNGNSMLNLK